MLFRENPDCTTWLWCDDVKTCWDGHTEYLPHFGCQLQWEPRRPWGQPPEGELIAKPSTFASGYVKSEYILPAVDQLVLHSGQAFQLSAAPDYSFALLCLQGTDSTAQRACQQVLLDYPIEY